MLHRLSRERLAFAAGVVATAAVLTLYAWRTIAVERLLRDQIRVLNEVVENQRQVLTLVRDGR
jgi:hypothetical protein